MMDTQSHACTGACAPLCVSAPDGERLHPFSVTCSTDGTGLPGKAQTDVRARTARPTRRPDRTAF